MSEILYGFTVALSGPNILYVIAGVVAGTVIGVLPGLGPITAIAIMIPLSFGMEPASAMILMAGVYYGAVFGGSTSSILLNAPGVSATVATAFDGYPMAQRGEPGKALAVAAISSFAGGTLAIIGLMFLAPTMARVALNFGAPEFFALMLLGVTMVTTLGTGSTVKALLSALVGFMVASIGLDPQTGVLRYTFGVPKLQDGIDFIVVALGLFALAEVFKLVSQGLQDWQKSQFKLSPLRVTRDDFRNILGPILRGSGLGFLVGVLPGEGGTVAALTGYAVEKRISKEPDSFGKGNIKGLASPEAANNAATGGAFVPLLTLGIPGSGTTAVLLGALLVMGIQPGPLLRMQHPDIFWGVIDSMWLGNLVLLILNLPLIPIFVRILQIPRPMLMAFIVVFSFLGVYGVSFSTVDIFLVVLFGCLGFVMHKLDFPPAPMILAVVLGPLMEQSLRQSLTIARGDWMILLQRPISLGLILLSAAVVIAPLVLSLWRARYPGQPTTST